VILPESDSARGISMATIPTLRMTNPRVCRAGKTVRFVSIQALEKL
jgi:hypothetical protein